MSAPAKRSKSTRFFTVPKIPGSGESACPSLYFSDPVFLLTYLFLGGKAPDCLDAGDINDDGSLDLSDAVYSLAFQFLGGDPPKSPYPECGIEDRINGLDCKVYEQCP